MLINLHLSIKIKAEKKIKIISHDILDKPNITVKVELDQRIRHGKHFGV